MSASLTDRAQERQVDNAARLHDELRDAAADGAITYLSRGRAGVVYRWWTSDHEYRLLTHRERKALLAMFKAETLCRYPGHRLPRGSVGMVGMPPAKESRSDQKRRRWQ